jgi:fibronectin type 3 domain-containing protein
VFNVEADWYSKSLCSLENPTHDGLSISLSEPGSTNSSGSDVGSLQRPKIAILQANSFRPSM